MYVSTGWLFGAADEFLKEAAKRNALRPTHVRRATDYVFLDWLDTGKFHGEWKSIGVWRLVARRFFRL